ARSGDDVAFGLENRCVPTADIWPAVHAALAGVGFAYPDDHPTAALSGGEKQRLAFAGVQALDPTILLLDEPTANLDDDGARLALDGIDLAVRGGEAVALTGRNGSGKSTLALLLAGLLRPLRGSVTGADAEALARLPAAALVRRVGTVFQDPEHQFVRGRAD